MRKGANFRPVATSRSDDSCLAAIQCSDGHNGCPFCVGAGGVRLRLYAQQQVYRQLRWLHPLPPRSFLAWQASPAAESVLIFLCSNVFGFLLTLPFLPYAGLCELCADVLVDQSFGWCRMHSCIFMSCFCATEVIIMLQMILLSWLLVLCGVHELLDTSLHPDFLHLMSCEPSHHVGAQDSCSLTIQTLP